MERASVGTRVGYDTSRPVGSFFTVARDVLLRPADFFSRLRSSEEGVDFTTSGSTWRQIAFVVICAYLSVLLTFIFSVFDPILGDGSPNIISFAEAFGSDPLGALKTALLSLVVWPLLAVLRLYVGTFMQQLFVRLYIGKENRGFRATFPVMAYSNMVLLLTWVPVIGALLGLYAIYVNTQGLRAMHDTTTRRALLAAIPLPVLTFVLLTVNYLQAL